MIELRPPTPPFQYATLAQRRDASRLGMWVFLATELLLFGALFAAYATYVALYPGVFADASRHLNLLLAAINTGVLLLSSLTMALAGRSARVGARRALTWLLGATGALGLIFLGIKLTEYAEHYRNHLTPGFSFVYPGDQPAHAELFFTLYFAMTGVHAIHLTVGVGLVAVMLLLARRGHLTPTTSGSLDLAGLYWHFVDVIWVFLYPLLYLVGRQ